MCWDSFNASKLTANTNFQKKESNVVQANSRTLFNSFELVMVNNNERCDYRAIILFYIIWYYRNR